jgi:hypothetical protein
LKLVTEADKFIYFVIDKKRLEIYDSTIVGGYGKAQKST